MTTTRTIGAIDLLGEADLTQLARHEGGPQVSLFMPTHRAGPDTRQDPIRFRNLVGRARDLLAERGTPDREADDLLADVRALGDDDEFWRHQADGLAVYVAPGLTRTFRVPLELTEDLSVGERFRLRPLLPLLTGDGHAFVLALSQNEVRLYEATRFTIAEVDPGSMPTSMAEALAHEDPEAQLQVRAGGQAGMYHGHGEGDEVDKQALERYLRAVDRGLIERIGAARKTPLVLAAVGYYQPIYAAVTAHPALVDHAVEGNPEARSPEELQAAAWQLVAPRFDADRASAVEALGQAQGTGTASGDVATVVLAALEGRVEALFVHGTDPAWGRLSGTTPPEVEVHDGYQPGDDDLADLAAAQTLLTGGEVYCDDAPDDDGSVVSARFRW